jgi:hypothetical protein
MSRRREQPRAQLRLHAPSDRSTRTSTARRTKPSVSGTLNERDEAPSGGTNASLRTIYGIMHGLVDDRLTNSNETRHLTVRSVTRVGNRDSLIEREPFPLRHRRTPAVVCAGWQARWGVVGPTVGHPSKRTPAAGTNLEDVSSGRTACGRRRCGTYTAGRSAEGRSAQTLGPTASQPAASPTTGRQ